MACCSLLPTKAPGLGFPTRGFETNAFGDARKRMRIRRGMNAFCPATVAMPTERLAEFLSGYGKATEQREFRNNGCLRDDGGLMRPSTWTP